jgi:hypothetical protein
MAAGLIFQAGGHKRGVKLPYRPGNGRDDNDDSKGIISPHVRHFLQNNVSFSQNKRKYS